MPRKAKSPKVCRILNNDGYEWGRNRPHAPNDAGSQCFLAVVTGRFVADPEETYRSLTGMTMTERQVDAIGWIDGCSGDESDVMVIRRMASHIGVKIQVVRP